MTNKDIKNIYDKLNELKQEISEVNYDRSQLNYYREQMAYLKGKCLAYEEFLIKNNLIRDPKEFKPIIPKDLK